MYNWKKTLTALAVGLCTLLPPLAAEPFKPDNDEFLLTRLPAGPSVRELAALRGAYSRNPNNLSTALPLAKAWLATARKQAEPRLLGYAEATLQPWLTLQDPPLEVRSLRADIAQHKHQFGQALDDLNHIIQRQPRNAQARLQRANIAIVTGDYPSARQDCIALMPQGEGLIGLTCNAAVGSLTGRLAKSTELLANALEQLDKFGYGNSLTPAARSWSHVVLADMQQRALKLDEAEATLRKAIEIQADNNYARVALTDLLLNQKRRAAAQLILRPAPDNDAVVLRRALLSRNNTSIRHKLTKRLSERFANSAVLGKTSHEREQAWFYLDLEPDADKALAMALKNWLKQKEPIDSYLLARASLNKGDCDSWRQLKDWQQQYEQEDRWLYEELKTLREKHTAGSLPACWR